MTIDATETAAWTRSPVDARRRVARGVVTSLSIWFATHLGAQLAAFLAIAIHHPGALTQRDLLFTSLAVDRHRAGRPWFGRAVGFGAVSTIGLSWYLLWLWRRTGSPTTWFDAQRDGWHRSTRWPWETFARSIEYATSPATVRAGHVQAWADLLFVALYVLAIVVLIRKRWWAEAVYVGLSTVSMATSYAYTSMARESTVLFPLTILAASTLRSRRWRWVFWVVLTVSAGVMLAQAGRFALNDWSD